MSNGDGERNMILQRRRTSAWAIPASPPVMRTESGARTLIAEVRSPEPPEPHAIERPASSASQRLPLEAGSVVCNCATDASRERWMPPMPPLASGSRSIRSRPRTSTSPRAHRALAGVLLFGLSACMNAGVLPRPAAPPATQDRAGSAHIAVLSIAPWQEYVGALQPAFPMDEQRALAEAIPNTMDIERRLLDVLALNARAALPSTLTRSVSTSTTTASGSTTTAADGTIAETARRDETSADSARRVSQSGNPADVALGALPQLQTPPRPTASPLDASLAVDPFVRYTAATALFQEVRLLQRYVRDVVIGPDQEGYVLRLQVTLMPSRRDLPLDAYTTLSFFAAQRDPMGSVRALSTDTAGRLTTPTSERNVRVVPIMVSDNLEGATEAASSAVRRQVSLGLLAALSGAGLAADGGRAVERLEGILGRQINSLLTVGQVSDNTLRVRFGAMNQPRTGLGLVPRNQTVTVLVIVPKATGAGAADNPRSVRVNSKTDFVNAWNGELLRQRSRDDLHNLVDRALKQYDVHIDEDDPNVAAMLAAVQEGNLSAFGAALRSLRQKCHSLLGRCPSSEEQQRYVARYAEAIWMDVGSILSTLPYSVTTAALPAAWEPQIDAKQRPLAVDDGKRLTVTVDGDPRLRGSEYSASMAITAGGATLAATSVIVDQSGRLNVAFPSPTGAGYCSTKPNAEVEGCKVETVRLCRVPGRWESDAMPCVAVPVAYVATKVPPQTAPGFRMAAGARVIAAASDRTGSVRLVVTREENAPSGTKINVRIDGAEVASVAAVEAGGGARPLNPTNGAYELTSSAVLMIKLENLDPSEPVSITATGAAQPDRLQFRVVQRGAAEQKPGGGSEP